MYCVITFGHDISNKQAHAHSNKLACKQRQHYNILRCCVPGAKVQYSASQLLYKVPVCGTARTSTADTTSLQRKTLQQVGVTCFVAVDEPRGAAVTCIR